MASPTKAFSSFDVVHLALTRFPADTRVRREALASASVGRSVAVVVSRHPGEPAEQLIDGLSVIRLPVTKKRGGPFNYVWQYIAFTLHCRSLLQRDPRFGAVRVVHVHTLPDFLIAGAVHLKHRGPKLILDLHEIFPEFAKSKYPGIFGALIAAGATYLERWSRRVADVTITVNAPIARLLAARPAKTAERIVIVHNTTDPTDFGPQRAPVASVRPKGARLVYHGTLTPLYGLDIAVKGVALAAHRGLATHFTITGDGPSKPSLLALVKELGMDSHVTFVDPMPQSQLPRFLCDFDGGLVPTRLDTMTRYSLSNKLLEYLHLGMPVLAARLPSYEEYFNDSSLWYWEAGSPESMADAVDRFIRSDPAERASRTMDAQRRMERFAWESERQLLLGVYRELLNAC